MEKECRTPSEHAQRKRCLDSHPHPSTTTTQRWPLLRAPRKEGFSVIPSKRQLFSMVPKEDGSSMCQLGTSPHFMHCRTRSPSSAATTSLVCSSPSPSPFSLSANMSKCFCLEDTITGLRQENTHTLKEIPEQDRSAASSYIVISGGGRRKVHST